MIQSIAKSSLSDGQRRLVELFQYVNFGTVTNLQIRAGEPHFVPPPLVVRKLKLGADNGPRPEAGLADFWLRGPVIEMLETIAAIGDGVVLAIDVRYGLPCTIELEGRIEEIGQNG